MNALSSSDFTKADDPFALFRRWFAEAAEKEINDPDAITLATVDSSGMPDARAMLCKQVDERGFVFYTNGQSAKGGEIAANPKAAILYHWKSLRRQVRARGPLARISDAESDAYFATRPRVSRIGAWASQQSRPLEFARQARAGGRRPHGEVRRRRHSAAASLGRVPADADPDRVLAATASTACTTASSSPARARAIRGGASGSILKPRAKPAITVNRQTRATRRG